MLRIWSFGISQHCQLKNSWKKLSVMFFKGTVHCSKMKVLVINYSPSCHSKQVRLSFIFGTQIKIFLMTSESFLILHWQQHNFNVQGPEGSKDIIKIVHQWFNRNFMKLQEYFLCAKKILCSEDEQRSFRFGTTWGWVISDRILFLGELFL